MFWVCLKIIYLAFQRFVPAAFYFIPLYRSLVLQADHELWQQEKFLTQISSPIANEK